MGLLLKSNNSNYITVFHFPIFFIHILILYLSLMIFHLLLLIYYFIFYYELAQIYYNYFFNHSIQYPRQSNLNHYSININVISTVFIYLIFTIFTLKKKGLNSWLVLSHYLNFFEAVFFYQEFRSNL